MLQSGVSGPFAKMWQGFLNTQQFDCGTPDGVFGDGTEKATKDFQTSKGLEADGKVGDGTFYEAVKVGWSQPEGYPFIPSYHFTTAERAPESLKWIVLHDMEVPEARGMAVEISSRFGAVTSPQASAHFCIDAVRVIQNVLLKDVAWHAESGNRLGVGLEHAGFATQTRTDWLDEYSKAQLLLSAALAADLCKRLSIPPVWLELDAIKRGEKGITDHARINDAFKGVGQGHRDCGKNFPSDFYIAAVIQAMGAV